MVIVRRHRPTDMLAGPHHCVRPRKHVYTKMNIYAKNRLHAACNGILIGVRSVAKRTPTGYRMQHNGYPNATQ